MPYIPPEIVKRAEEMDLLTYLQNYEPEELVKVGNGTYTTKTHDSIRISNGLWNWFSEGVGGKNAISYLMKVKNYSFLEAVETIIGNVNVKKPVIHKEEKQDNIELVLPQKSNNSERAKIYLMSRGIAPEIINECINDNLIYESLPNHNVVFIGFDDSKSPKYAFYRGTNKTRFMGEAKGSDKKYTFRLEAKTQCTRVHLFESAIDLLSYATLLKMKNIDWHKENMISLGGVNNPSKINENNKIPIAIKEFLEKNPNINEIHLHLDNDEVGRNASKSLQDVLSKKYTVLDRPAPLGKDCNDYLKYVLGIKKLNKNAKEKVCEVAR
ncbi:MAG TPA: toprim domain-containing protein [Clostridiaceae bacterium]|nr:toprim domain-containing protein [Clostridiaceae bacterium]